MNSVNAKYAEDQGHVVIGSLKKIPKFKIRDSHFVSRFVRKRSLNVELKGK